MGPGGELAATKIQLAREARVTSLEVIRVNGLVTELVSQSVLSSEFRVGYQRVRTDKETKFQRGDWKDIELGVRLEVRGKLENGVLIARKITFAKK